MGDVIHVDFRAKRGETREERYLRICRETLDPDDYADLLEAIADPVSYRAADEDLQEIAYWYLNGT